MIETADVTEAFVSIRLYSALGRKKLGSKLDPAVGVFSENNMLNESRQLTRALETRLEKNTSRMWVNIREADTTTTTDDDRADIKPFPAREGTRSCAIIS